MRIFSSIIDPTSGLLTLGIPNDIHRSPVRPKPIRDHHLWPTVTLHRTLQKLKRSPAIPAFRRKSLEHLAFVIDSAPEVMRLAVDPHEHLVRVPAPTRI